MMNVIAMPTSGSARSSPSCDEYGAEHDAERDERVDARVVTVRDERRAVQTTAGAQPHLRSHLVARDSRRAGGCYPAEVRELLRVDQALDRCVERDASAHEDREDDEVAGDLLGPRAAHEERDAERHCGQRVAGVVDEVGEQRDAAAGDEDDRLERCSDPEHTEADRHRTHAGAAADDRSVDEPVAVSMVVRHGTSLY